MSEFFKALGQAERDRALQEQARRRESAPVDVPPTEEVESVAEEARPATPRPEPEPSRSTLFRWPGVTAARTATAPVELGDVETLEEDAVEEGLHGLDAHLVSLVMPASFEAEQYRALRQMVDQLHVSAGLAVIAISSPSVGDGKTTTAINLAGALAQSADGKVLLVDCDLRRPGVEATLGLRISPSPGLVGAILEPRLSLADVVRRRPPFNLDVLPAGDTPSAPYELLKSPRFGELMEEARQRYDYVVVDTPPLVAVPDCRVISRWVDGFVVVVAAHRTPRRLVEEALTVVELDKMIGLVFNRDERPLSGYYHYAYRAASRNGHRKWRWGRR
ncbi:MAG TPA: CpsD/CapB family tyrosine-protein kinase [Methylomirabilota bacterium]|jgi:capsular exopolysaccharide synthesis family protein